MRTAVAVLIVIIAVGVSGCGGSSGSDNDQIRQVMKDFGSAMANGKYGDACDLVSPAAKKRMEAKGAGCAAGMLLASAFLGKEALAKFKSIDAKSVTIDGNTATVAIQGEKTGSTLVKVDGKWRIGENRSAGGETDDSATTSSDNTAATSTGAFAGGGTIDSLDAVSLEDSLADDLSSQLSAGGEQVAVSVECPLNVTGTAGSTVSCTAKPQGSDMLFLDVTFEDDQGSYSYTG